ELRPQAPDDLIGGELAIRLRLERGEHETAVHLAAALRAAAGEADYGVDRRIGLHDADELAQLPLHRLEGDGLIGLDTADQAPGILLREETLGDHDPEVDIEDHGGDQQHDDHA